MSSAIIRFVQSLADTGSPRARFVLAHGRRWTAAGPPRPRELRRGRSKGCFGAAGRLALTHPEWRYVEGYVAVGSPVVEHAWLVDNADRVIEMTLPAHATAYFGVAFSQRGYRSCFTAGVRCWCLLCFDALPRLLAHAESRGVPVTELLEWGGGRPWLSHHSQRHD